MASGRIRLGRHTYLAVRRRDVLDVLDDRQARTLVRRILGERPTAAGDLQALARDLSGEYRLSRERALAIIAEGIARGDLRAIRLDATPAALGELDPTDPHDPIEPVVPVVERTFLSVTFVHESGATYPGATFDVELPGGAVETVDLDGHSAFRIEDIEGKGPCRVRPRNHTYQLTPEQKKAGGPVVVPRADDAHASVGEGHPVVLKTGEEHRVVVRELQLQLRLRLEVTGKPLADLPFVLRVDGETIEGTTGSDGLLEADISSQTTSARLELPSRGEVCELDIRPQLPAATKPAGATIRYDNLGLPHKPTVAEPGARLTAATREFQMLYGLPVTAELDGPTAEQLKARHGC